MKPEMKLNFLSNDEQPNKAQVDQSFSEQAFIIPKKPGFNLTKLILILAIAFLIIFGSLASILAFSKNQIFDDLSKMNLFGQVGQLMTSQDKKLIGEDQDRVNFLLIGIGGKNHEGGTLADTIILLSLKPSTNQVALMSIPRDLYVKADGYGWNKINAISAYAERKKSGSGGEETAKALATILNQEIPYYAVIDFDGFEKLIDEFGGVDIIVDNDLIDYQYPIRGREDSYPISSRFEKLVIKKGAQHLDGKTALKFSRSRHALGSEGSDFARSKRQQKVIIGLREKIVSSQTLMSPGKISSLLSAYNNNVTTNLQLWEMLRLFKFSKDIDTTKIIHQQLTDGATSFLYSQILNGAYVLLPVGGSYAKIKAVWQNVFTTSTDFTISATNEDANLAKEIKKLNEQSKKEKFTVVTSTPKATTTPTSTVATSTPIINNEPVDQIQDSSATENTGTSKTEKATIEIRNGTTINGWATSEKTKLISKGLTVSQTANAPTKDYKAIAIYDLSGGKYPNTAKELVSIYGISPSNDTPPFTSSASFLIILGK